MLHTYFRFIKQYFSVLFGGTSPVVSIKGIKESNRELLLQGSDSGLHIHAA